MFTSTLIGLVNPFITQHGRFQDDSLCLLLFNVAFNLFLRTSSLDLLFHEFSFALGYDRELSGNDSSGLKSLAYADDVLVNRTDMHVELSIQRSLSLLLTSKSLVLGFFRVWYSLSLQKKL